MIYFFGLPDGTQMDKRWGRIVTGEVVLDGKQMLNPGDRVCSDPILRSPGNQVHTRTGQVYSLTGSGREYEFPVTVLEQVHAHQSPEDIAHAIGEQWR